MKEMDWATGACRDAGVTEMGCAMGSIYLGDSGVDLVSRLASSHNFLSYNELYTPSFASFDLTRSFRDSVWIHAIAWILTAG
jgi:hypothetical protein